MMLLAHALFDSNSQPHLEAAPVVDPHTLQVLPGPQARGLIASIQAASGQADDTDLVRGVLACGFYPLLGCLEATGHTASSNPNKTRLVTASGEEVHPRPLIHAALC